MARRPVPTSLKLIRGNLGKRAINRNEPAPPVDDLACPDYLSSTAAQEWARIVPVLVALGLATTADRTVLAAYCALHAEMVERAKTGREQRTASIAQLRACMTELGLTPASRAKLTVQPRQGDDKEARYFGAN